MSSMSSKTSELRSLAQHAQNSGESSGRLLGEYVDEMLDDGSGAGTVAADMDALIEWAKRFKKIAAGTKSKPKRHR